MATHAIVTTDPYTEQRRRHDVQAVDRLTAENAAREVHGHETGIDTAEVTAEYFGIVP